MTDPSSPRTLDSESSPLGWLAHPWTGPLTLAAFAIAMLVWTWGRYGDPFVDFGREIYVAWRLSAGQALYRDIDYFNGPLSPYFNALIFRLFGPSVLCLEMANLFWWTMLAVMAYRLYAAMSDRLSAFAATLMFILLFSFLQLTGVANYNFLTPYAHEATHSLTCALAALTLLGFHLRQPELHQPYRKFSWPVAGCGLLLGAMFLMKVEITLAAAAALATGISLHLLAVRAKPGRWLQTWLVLTAAAIVPSIAAFALLSLAMPSHQAMQGLLGSWKYLHDAALTGNPFYRRVTGVDRPWPRAIKMLTILAGELLLLLPPAVAAMVARRNTTSETRWVAASCSGAYVLVTLWIFWDSADWQASMLPLNLITLLCILVLAVLAIRQRANPSPRLILQLSFSVFAAALLAKIFFNIAIYHYGFALASPAFGLLVMILMSWIPAAIHRTGGTGWVFRAAVIAAMGAFSLKHLMAYENVYRSVPVQTIGTGADEMNIHGDAQGINLVLSFLKQLPPDQTLATVPQGAMINYLSRRVNPTGEITLLPGEVNMFGDQRIMDRFQRHPPDWIVTVQTNFAEFGSKGFGVDYAQGLARFIRDNYDPVPLSRDPDFRLNLRMMKFDPGHRMEPGSMDHQSLK
jgi:hypothetical protein